MSSDQLTPMQLRVVDLAALGLTNAEIGERLLLRPNTVKTHLEGAGRALGMTNRAGIVGESYRRGLLPYDEAALVAEKSKPAPPRVSHREALDARWRERTEAAGFAPERSPEEWVERWNAEPELFDDIITALGGGGGAARVAARRRARARESA
jgi:DNA-binding CsgD family transcriptional regulator